MKGILELIRLLSFLKSRARREGGGEGGGGRRGRDNNNYHLIILYHRDGDYVQLRQKKLRGGDACKGGDRNVIDGLGGRGGEGDCI